jgi:hypothetical protein
VGSLANRTGIKLIVDELRILFNKILPILSRKFRQRFINLETAVFPNPLNLHVVLSAVSMQKINNFRETTMFPHSTCCENEVANSLTTV